jgi:SNF2 family DNA or RNA helicase
VEVIKLIAENSIEERVVSLQDEKKELVDKVISNDDSSIKKLSIKDLKSILNM